MDQNHLNWRNEVIIPRFEWRLYFARFYFEKSRWNIWVTKDCSRGFMSPLHESKQFRCKMYMRFMGISFVFQNSSATTSNWQVCGLTCVSSPLPWLDSLALVEPCKQTESFASWHSLQVLLCFIDPKVKQIRNEVSNCPGIFSRTFCFYYVASSPSCPLPHHRISYPVSLYISGL